jgi:hypothetical protein
MQFHSLLTWALDGGERSVSCPGNYTPNKRSPLEPLKWRLVGPEYWFECFGEEKNLAHSTIQTHDCPA